MKLPKLVILTLILATFCLASPGTGFAQAKPITLKWVTHEPNIPGSSQDILRYFAEEIAKQTEGRVVLKIHWGGVLGKEGDHVRMVGGPGIADGGFIMTTYSQWEIPLVAAMGLPFFTDDYEAAMIAGTNLYNNWDAMQAELKKVNIKPLYFMKGLDHWVGFSKPVTKIEDFKGKQAWCGGYWQYLAKPLGIVNVVVDASQAYESLERGLLNGIIGMPYHTWKVFKYSEIAKNFVKWPYGGQPLNFHGINLDVWNKIDSKDKAIIENIFAGLNDVYFPILEKEEADLRIYFKENGVTEYELTPEEYVQIETMGKELIWGEWVKTAESKGVPGQEFMERFQAAIDQAGQ